MDSLTWLQIRALLRLRYQLMRQSWSANPNWHKAGVYLTTALVAFFSLGLASSFFWIMRFLFHHRTRLQGIWELEVGFMLIFFLMGLVWCFLPILMNLQSKDLELDITKLILYPLSASQLHVVTVLLKAMEPLSLFFYPWLMALTLAALWELGISSLVWFLILSFVFAMVHVVWGRLLINLVTVLFNSRRLRELLLLLTVLLLIGFSLLPAFVSLEVERHQALTTTWKGIQAYLLPSIWSQRLSLPLNMLSAFSPAGMISQAIMACLYGLSSVYVSAVAGLLLWLSLGNYLDWMLVKRLYTHPQQEQNDAASWYRQKPIPEWWYQWFNPAALAIAAKELHYLQRSALGKILFCLPLMITVVFRLLLIYEPWDLQRNGLTILSSLTSYMFLTAMFLFSNTFGWDGEGFQTFVLSPVSGKDILHGKNLAMALFVSVEMLCLMYLYLVLFGLLNVTQWLQLLIFYGILLFGILTLGNMISLRFPSRVELNQGRYKQQGLPVLICLNLFSILLSTPLLIRLLAWWSGESPLLIGLGVLVCVVGSYYALLPYAVQLFEQQKLLILAKIIQQD